MNGLARRVAVVASMAILVLSVVPAVTGYDGQVASHVGVSAVCQPPTTSQANATVSATVVDNGGNPVTDVEVVWSVDGVVLAKSTTDQQGRAYATFGLPVGDTTVVAKVGELEGRAIVVCPAGAVGGAIGLPRTDTAPAELPLGIMVLVAAVATVAGAIVRRSLFLPTRSR